MTNLDTLLTQTFRQYILRMEANPKGVCLVSGKEVRIVLIFTDLLKAYSFISVFLAMPLKLHPSAVTKLNRNMKLEKTSAVALSTKSSNVPFL